MFLYCNGFYVTVQRKVEHERKVGEKLFVVFQLKKTTTKKCDFVFIPSEAILCRTNFCCYYSGKNLGECLYHVQ